MVEAIDHVLETTKEVTGRNVKFPLGQLVLPPFITDGWSLKALTGIAS